MKTGKIKPVPQRIDVLKEVFSDRRFPDFGNAGWCRCAAARPGTLLSHSHKGAYEICLMRHGSAFWQVGGDVFHVEPGDLFITWPDELHGGENQVMHTCELYWLIFRLAPRTGSFGLSPQQTKQFQDALQALPGRIFKAPPEIGKHFDRLLGAFADPGPFSETTVQAAVQTILCDVLTVAGQPDATRRAACSPRIQKVINRLYAADGTAMPVEEMAATAGLKPGYFREQFRKETGYSPVEYLTRLRIQKAKTRLLETGASITDIAFELGFSSSQYFASTFRKVTGETPLKFRQQHRRKDC
ncbi:MAG: AraC family transcriptional regulator [Kiritimatiellales bacterium]|jgi:AraC-like DNA-binding protein